MGRKALASKLHAYRASRGISARALSLSAGLGPAYIHNIEQGRWTPRPDALMRIAGALGLTGEQTAELRRLAGIDPDPGRSPEAKAARAAHWQQLLYLLVNHELLPFQEIDAALSQVDADTASLMQAALIAPHGSALEQTHKGACPRGVAKLLDTHFGHVVPDTLSHLIPLDNDRYWITSLAEARAPGSIEPVFSVYFMEFECEFAIALFPAVYHTCCRHWPFDKVALPYGQFGRDVQHRIYDQVRSGLSVDGLVALLSGRGPQLDRGPSTRRVPAFTMPLDRQPECVRELVAADYLFDHLDRCEFLEQFPGLKVHPGRAARAVGYSDDAGLTTPSLEDSDSFTVRWIANVIRGAVIGDLESGNEEQRSRVLQVVRALDLFPVPNYPDPTQIACILCGSPGAGGTASGRPGRDQACASKQPPSRPVT